MRCSITTFWIGSTPRKVKSPSLGTSSAPTVARYTTVLGGGHSSISKHGDMARFSRTCKTSGVACELFTSCRRQANVSFTSTTKGTLKQLSGSTSPISWASNYQNRAMTACEIICLRRLATWKDSLKPPRRDSGILCGTRWGKVKKPPKLGWPSYQMSTDWYVHGQEQLLFKESWFWLMLVRAWSKPASRSCSRCVLLGP